MEELIKNINWKSTKGIVLISLVGLIIFGVAYLSVPDDKKYYSFISLLLIVVLIIKIVSPKQTIIIGEEAEVGGEIIQEKTETSIGTQSLIVHKKGKVTKGIGQK